MKFLSPEPTRVGLVCLARLTFEADLAAQWYAQAQQMIGAIGGVQVCAVKKLVIERKDAEAAIAELRAADIDALIVLSGTFALGGLAMQFAQAFAPSGAPLLLWAWPEPREQTGKLRLNSLVGVTVNASNLYKLGYRPLTLYAAMDEPRTTETITRFAQTAGLLRDLRRVRIGLIGGHAPGFDNLGVNKLWLRRELGIEVIDIGLQTVIARAKAIAAGRVESSRPDIMKPFDDISEVNAQQGDAFTALTLALQDLAAEGQFDALAIKCWGDLAESYGMAACGAVARLNDDKLVVGCEGDVMGTLTSLIAQRLTGTPAYLTDLVLVEPENNTALFWHIGCAPLRLADPNQPKHLYAHFAGGKGLTAGFGLKPGRVTVLRLGEDGHNLRMLATMGMALETPMDIRGTVSRVIFDGDVSAFLDELLSNGWEHHLVLAYGEILPELEMLSRMLKVALVKPTGALSLAAGSVASRLR